MYNQKRSNNGGQKPQQQPSKQNSGPAYSAGANNYSYKSYPQEDAQDPSGYDQGSSKRGGRGGRGAAGGSGYQNYNNRPLQEQPHYNEYQDEELGYDHPRKQRGGHSNKNYEEIIYQEDYDGSYSNKRGGGYRKDQQQNYGYQRNSYGDQSNQAAATLFRGKGRGQQHDTYNERGSRQGGYYQQPERGRGRGRGAPVKVVSNPLVDFIPTSMGRGANMGRGASMYVSSTFKDSSGNTQLSYKEYELPQTYMPYQYGGQEISAGSKWVSDYQPDINYESGEDQDKEEQKKETPHYSGNFRPSGIPGVIHFQRQPPQPDVKSSVQKGTAAQDDGSKPQFLQKYDHRYSFEEIFEEKVIHANSNMNICFTYKEFRKPDYYQGPQFVIYKDQSKIRNHKYPDYAKDDEDLCYEIAAYPPKPKEKQERQPPRQKKRSSNSLQGNQKELVKREEGFNPQAEKKAANKYWKEQEKNAESGSSAKQPKRKVILLTKESKRGPKKGKFEKRAAKDKKDKKKVNFEEYLEVEEEIKRGIEGGQYFEGLFRVNPNNRNRAFVSINGLPVDVMIEGLASQNRALDGDTVIIQLLSPSRWPALTTNNLVIGGKAGVSTQITNETAIETRVVDVERGALHTEAHQASMASHVHSHQGRAESPRRESVIVCESASESVKESESEVDERKYSEKALQKELERDDEELGNFKDDEVVNSSEDDELESESSYEEEDKKKPSKNSKKEDPKKGQAASKLSRAFQDQFYHCGSKSLKQILSEITELSKECRPLGRVKAIFKSTNREKELMVTLIVQDKERLEDDTFIKLLSSQSGKHSEGRTANKIAQNSGIYAIPISKKLPWMSISNIPQELIDDVKMGKKPQNRYYIAKFESWNIGFIRPLCSILSHIGEAGDLKAESLRILKMHDVYSDEYETQDQPLNEKVHESLRVFTKDLDKMTGEWRIPEEEIKQRLDLRKKRIFTIDPLTAKDLDDALSIDKISDDLYEIGVHIADVSYFVQQGTELDREAQLRCTSVYFVHRVYPMLPRLLCERLCSLNPQVDRLSYSIFFRMKLSTGEVDKSSPPRIARSVMRSCSKWNYQLVQDILDKKITKVDQLEEQYRPKEHKFDDMVADCFLMHQIAQKRRASRMEHGSIMLSNREFLFRLDPESQLPLNFVESKTRMPSKHLVEEYMLLANILIAEHLYKYCADKTLLRAHPDLDAEKKTKLEEFFTKAGLEGLIDLTNSKSLSLSLEALRSQGDSGRFNVAMRKFLTCLQCAKYMCINDSDPEEYQHYGLNFALYTHFTSPIRRYADLLVHRLVTLSLKHEAKTRELIELMDYSKYADLCSEKSLNAKRASTQCTRLFHCLLLKSQGQKAFETLLFDMDSTGNISIYIDEVNMHHKVHLRDDPRIDSVIFFEEQLIIAAHVKQPKKPNKEANHDASTATTKLEAFKLVKSIEELEGPHSKFAPEELLILRVFDKVKVRVDTTTEFPLDIKCSLIFGPEDLQDFNRLVQEQEAAQQTVNSGLKVTDSQDNYVENDNLDVDV